MRVKYLSNTCVIICKKKIQKGMTSPESKEMYMMTKTVPATQYGDDNIQYMLPVACDDNTKGTWKIDNKSESFDEKTKNSSAPF